MNADSEKGLSVEVYGRECVLVTPRSANRYATGLERIDGPRVAWNPGAILWTEVFPRLGSRDYASASPVYDDYSFWEITWHADLAMRQGPTASATIAYSSERHTDRSRDAAYTYVSVAMRFPIRL